MLNLSYFDKKFAIVKEQPEFIWCFNEFGIMEKVKSSNLGGVSFVNKTSGEVLTNYYWMPDARLYGRPLYISKEALLNSINFEI